MSLGEAVERLALPHAMEEFSPVGGEAFFLVDLRGASAAQVESSHRLLKARLSQLPCPSIALTEPVDENSPVSTDAAALSRLCSEFDLVIGDSTQLAGIVSRIEDNPLASAALAALLRHNEKCTVHEGLVAESLVYSTLQSGPEFARWLARKPAPRPAVSDFEPAVLISREGKTLHLRLNRPHKHNAFCIEMRDRLCEGLNLAAADPSIKEIRLDGAGPSFCSGGDLDEFGSFPDPATAHAVRCTRNPARSMAAVARRCRVRVHGACVGAGIEFPAFAAKLTASPNAYFQLPEVSMGLVPGAGGTVSICKRIGRQQIAFMALSAEPIDAKTALAWGLIDGIEDT